MELETLLTFGVLQRLVRLLLLQDACGRLQEQWSLGQDILGFSFSIEKSFSYSLAFGRVDRRTVCWRDVRRLKWAVLSFLNNQCEESFCTAGEVKFCESRIERLVSFDSWQSIPEYADCDQHLVQDAVESY